VIIDTKSHKIKWSTSRQRTIIYSHFSPKIFIFINVLNAYSYPRISRKCDFKQNFTLVLWYIIPYEQRKHLQIIPIIFVKINTQNIRHIYKNIYLSPFLVTSSPSGRRLDPLLMFTKISKNSKISKCYTIDNVSSQKWYYDILTPTKSWKFAEIHGFSWLALRQLKLSVILWSSRCTSHNFGSTDWVSLNLKWWGAIPVFNSSQKSFQFVRTQSPSWNLNCTRS